jgi:hypothetical protein
VKLNRRPRASPENMLGRLASAANFTEKLLSLVPSCAGTCLRKPSLHNINNNPPHTMAVDKKRKSVDAVATATKKAKTAPAVEKAAPLKSALKGSKAKVETAATAKVEKKKDNGAKKEKTVVKAKKPIDKKPVVMKEIEVVEEEPTSDADADEAEELTADQTAELLAGFSSSEDEADEEEEQAIAISEIPNAPIVKHVQKLRAADARVPRAVRHDHALAPGAQPQDRKKQALCFHRVCVVWCGGYCC